MKTIYISFSILLLIGNCKPNNTADLQHHQQKLIELYNQLNLHNRQFNTDEELKEAHFHIDYLINNSKQTDRYHYQLMKARMYYIEGKESACLNILKIPENRIDILYYTYSGIINELMDQKKEVYQDHYHNALTICQSKTPEYREVFCKFVVYLVDGDDQKYCDYFRLNYGNQAYEVLKMQFNRFDDLKKTRRYFILDSFLDDYELPQQ